jgi:hypothetical protein
VRVAVFGVMLTGLGLLNASALVTVSKAGTATGGVRSNRQHNVG